MPDNLPPAAFTGSALAPPATADNDESAETQEEPRSSPADDARVTAEPSTEEPWAPAMSRPQPLSAASLASNVADGANAIAQAIGGGLARFTNPTAPPSMPSTDPWWHLQQPELRHTHSTPLQGPRHRHTLEAEEDALPPPLPLDPFQRSSSTPSSFRQRSANSAFGLFGDNTAPSPSTTTSHYAAMGSAFDVVHYYARGIDDMERTSIEVVSNNNQPTQTKPAPVDQATLRKPEGQRKPAAFRAKKYLTRFPVLKRRLRHKIGGRENPAQPESPNSRDKDITTTTTANEEAVTVTVVEQPSVHDTSVLSRSSEVSAINASSSGQEDEGSTDTKSGDSIDISSSKSDDVDNISNDKDDGDSVEDNDASPIEDNVRLPTSEESDILSPAEPIHCQTDESDSREDTAKQTPEVAAKAASDQDEDEIIYQKIETQLGESPTPIASPSYQKMDSPTPPSAASKTRKMIRIQVSDDDVKAQSPIPAPQTTPCESDISPGTKSSQTTGSSGHTTNAASISSSSTLLQSGLSTISETDREVMEANQQGRRRRVRSATPAKPTDGASSIHSSSTNSSSGHGNYYLALDGTSPLREGAAVVPGSSTPANLTHTTTASSSGSSSAADPQPPTFVSYLERGEAEPSERDDGGQTRDELLGEMRFEVAAQPQQQTTNARRSPVVKSPDLYQKLESGTPSPETTSTTTMRPTVIVEEDDDNDDNDDGDDFHPPASDDTRTVEGDCVTQDDNGTILYSEKSIEITTSTTTTAATSSTAVVTPEKPSN